MSMPNTQLTSNLHIFLLSQSAYIKYNIESESWYSLLDYPYTFFIKIKYLNSEYPSYKNNLLPILHKGDDDYICLYNNKYYLIHAGTEPGWEANKNRIFSTPQEVWEKVIKPDIEEYYKDIND